MTSCITPPRVTLSLRPPHNTLLLVKLANQIAESAAGPETIQIDRQVSTEHPLPDQIAAAKFILAQGAKGKAGAGVTFQKLVPHGAVE